MNKIELIRKIDKEFTEYCKTKMLTARDVRAKLQQMFIDGEITVEDVIKKEFSDE
jgi:hypothetical protein